MGDLHGAEVKRPTLAYASVVSGITACTASDASTPAEEVLVNLADGSSPERQALTELAVESWRFARLFARLVSRLDAGEQGRYESKVRWYVKRLEEQLAVTTDQDECHFHREHRGQGEPPGKQGGRLWGKMRGCGVERLRLSTCVGIPGFREQRRARCWGGSQRR